MEEKERYKWSQDVIVECPYEDYDYIVDTENNIIFSDDNYFKLVDLLNQQSKRIKELEQENTILKKALELATNYCQREIDGDGIGMQDIQAIYEIGTEFFINKTNESIK